MKDLLGRWDGEPRPDAAEVGGWLWADPRDLVAWMHARPWDFAPWFPLAVRKLGRSQPLLRGLATAHR